VQKVLLVEDNPVNQEVARAMLQTLSVGVESASSGKAALEKLAAARYDVVLMDCQMPDMDGYETTQRFREWELLEGRPRTPVVALTANALAGDAEKCLAAGMDHYVSKPFTIEQLHAVLEECAPPGSPGSLGGGTAGKMLDLQTVERIRAMNPGGSSDLFKRLAELYVTSSAALVETLSVVARTGDAHGVAQAAHALKSSSANVGALSLAATCGELELVANENKTELIEALVARLLREHSDVLNELEQKHLAA
jgi:CheY-like chemotaxis protein